MLNFEPLKFRVDPIAYHGYSYSCDIQISMYMQSTDMWFSGKRKGSLDKTR